MKIKLAVKFVDFWPGFNSSDNGFLNLVKEFYEVEYSDQPDVLFFSCYGTEFLKYNCPRIFYTAENIRPDFRFCDFALSFDYLEDKRHFRWPLYRRWFSESDLTKPRNPEDIVNQKNDFCSFVVSNSKESEQRIHFFYELSKYKKVASGGNYANNVGGPVPNKREFIKDYLFNIAFENSSYPGYTTEKIAEPWVEGCIPIYWGDPEVTRDINPDCFINIHNFESFDTAVEYIKQVDKSKELQKRYLGAPFFRNNEVPLHLKDEFISQRLKEIIDQCLSGLSNKVARFWHKPYYFIRKIRGGSRLIKIKLR